MFPKKICVVFRLERLSFLILNKEEKLFNMGIKCLSLFFIDEVAKYRQYDENGDEVLGEYGQMFEQEYINVLNNCVTLLETPYQKYLKSST